MTPDQFLSKVAQLHLEWTDRVAEDVPTNSADQRQDGPTDYPEHHHDISATAEQQDDFNAELVRLIEEYQAEPSVSRSQASSVAHRLVNGICVTCTTASRNFNPHQPRDPHTGKWIDIGGVDVPDLGALYKLDNFDQYEKTYEPLDESPSVNGFTAVSMVNGEAQVAFDTDTHRYVLADTDPDGMREFADTLERLLDDYHSLDEEDLNSAEPGIIDDQTWDDITVGYDATGDFRITSKDTGHDVHLPEISAEQVQQLIDGLREQADQAEAQLEG